MNMLYYLHLYIGAKNAHAMKVLFQDLSISLLLMLPSQAPQWQHCAQNNDLSDGQYGLQI